MLVEPQPLLEAREAARAFTAYVEAMLEEHRASADASPLVDPPNEGIQYSVVDIDADGGLG